MTRTELYEYLGMSWCSRLRRRVRMAGTYAVARQLRKSGVGLQTALLLLTRGPR